MKICPPTGIIFNEKIITKRQKQLSFAPPKFQNY